MYLKGHIASVLSVLLLVVFLSSSYDGYSKQYERSPEKSVNKTDEDNGHSRQEHTLSVALEATITVFSMAFAKVFDFKSNAVAAPPVPDGETIPLNTCIKSEILRTLFFRIIPVNAP